MMKLYNPKSENEYTVTGESEGYYTTEENYNIPKTLVRTGYNDTNPQYFYNIEEVTTYWKNKYREVSSVIFKES